MADEFYGQRDVMRMPEPEEFRQLHQHRATPFPPNLAFPNPNLDRRGFSRASSTSSWEMLGRLGVYGPILGRLPLRVFSIGKYAFH